jgi:hypothetical protein
MTKGVLLMEALTPRQFLAEQLAAFIRRHGGHPINPLPLEQSEHLRFEICLSDSTLVNRLQRFGFDLRLLSHSKRLDPWASTEIIRTGNPQQLRQQPAVIDIRTYEVELPIVNRTQE